MARTVTRKMLRFIDEYLIDLNATQAAIRAGYSKRSAKEQGYRILNSPSVRDLIQEKMEQKKSELIAKQDEVLQYLTAVMRGETESEVVVVENIGDFMSEARRVKKKPDEKERLKAGELLGKRYGLFTDKVDVDGAIPVVISGENELSD